MSMDALGTRPIVAIDPGANGGIAWVDLDGIVRAVRMPDGMTEQADYLRSLFFELHTCHAVIEKTGTHVAGNSASASVKFARHCGNLEAILYMAGFSTLQVAPAVWQKHFGTLPKDKAERKRSIKEEMQRRYPHLSVTLATGDALGILSYATSKGLW